MYASFPTRTTVTLWSLESLNPSKKLCGSVEHIVPIVRKAELAIELP